MSLAGEESGQMWDIISNYLYQLLGETHRQSAADRQTGRQTDRHAGRQTDRQTGRQAPDSYMVILIPLYDTLQTVKNQSIHLSPV